MDYLLSPFDDSLSEVSNVAANGSVIDQCSTLVPSLLPDFTGLTHAMPMSSWKEDLAVFTRKRAHTQAFDDEADELQEEVTPGQEFL